MFGHVIESQPVRRPQFVTHISEGALDRMVAMQEQIDALHSLVRSLKQHIAEKEQVIAVYQADARARHRAS